jgi:hypothetical protein
MNRLPSRYIPTAWLLGFLSLAVSAAEPMPLGAETSRVPRSHITATFSIVAVDPASGVCGAAVASKYPAVGKVVPIAVGGVGAFCTQHYHVPKWRQQAIDLLREKFVPKMS